MSVGFWCVLISAVLIYIAKIPVAWAMQKDERGYDNRHPRTQQQKLTGLGARALASHQNSIEAFPLFAAAVFMATSASVVGAWTDMLAIIFVVARVLYLICYWADWHWQRTLVWSVGLASCLMLMLTPLMA